MEIPLKSRGMEHPQPSRVRRGRFLSWFSCCFGEDSQYHENDLQPLNLYNPSAIQVSVDQLVARSREARAETFSKIGKLHDFILEDDASSLPASVANWPAARQRFRVIVRPRGKTLLLVSDGLSDPFDDLQEDSNVNGYGLEFYVETPVSEIGLDIAEIKSSWQFQLLSTVCAMAAGHGGIRQIIDHMDLLSTEAEGISESIPSESRQSIVNSQSRVGALLGLADERQDNNRVPKMIDGMPLTDVRLVNVKLIQLQELKLITDLGADGRSQLARLFPTEEKSISSLHRPSVV